VRVDNNIPPLEWDPETSSNTEYTSDNSVEIAAPQRQGGARRRRILIIGSIRLTYYIIRLIYYI
jgi:hypothetical protein